ncbi:MAG: GntR family transcriptional regulator [Bacteroidetes bacterium]|nr:GntR family transcriptional regulator [Bacteroidota bacterium]
MGSKEKKSVTLTNQIAEILKDEINYGKIKPGEALIERQLAERFSASNIPVREALRILEGKGFIVHRKFSGYTVREINPEEMVELYDISQFLSSQLLSKGIPRYTELTYHRFRSLIEAMTKSTDTDKSVSLLIDFAETAYAPAGLDYSMELAKQLLHRNIPIIQGMVERIYGGKIPTDFHRKFMELCQKKETQKATQCWLEEFEKMTKSFVTIINQLKNE